MSQAVQVTARFPFTTAMARVHTIAVVTHAAVTNVSQRPACNRQTLMMQLQALPAVSGAC